MSDEEWQRVEELFLVALDIPPAERAAFLDGQCVQPPGLRQEVESLLAADATAGQRIASVVADSAAGLLASDSIVGARLGPYEVVREIGRGGMGAVYSAVRADRVFEKRVAIKVVKRGVDTDAVVERFRHERQILAGLDHPYITRLLDGGTSADGRPYFVMEFVEGHPMQEFCNLGRLSVQSRVELFRKVCEAVAYAHRNLVIHRDLKPANILVTADGTPKLLDFGIARLLSVDPGDNTLGLPGNPGGPLTPAYASPEQLRGEAVTTATDVYSLGAILYEILSGQAPRSDRGDGRERVDGKASEAAGAKELKRALAGDLDNIVLKATHPEQALRYRSVDHLSDDLQRFLTGRPVAARDDRFAYRTRKFLQRHRVAVGAGVLVVASLCTGLGLSLAEQKKTQKRFNEVRALANSILFELHDEIAKLPGATRARSMVLAKAVTYLDGLAKDAAGDMSLQKELANAYIRVGELQSSNLGDTRESVTSYGKAVEIARVVRSAAPQDAKRSLLLVEALGGLGRQESLSGQTQSGRQHIDEGSRILEGVVVDNPEGLELALRLNILLAGLARHEGENLRALTELRRAAKTVQRLRKVTPADKADSWESIVNWQLAGALSQTGDLKEADRVLEQAIKIAESLAARFPQNASLVRQVWVNRQSRALFAGSPQSVNEGDLAASLELYREAERQHRQEVESDSANIRWRVDLIASNFGVALVTSEISPADGLPLLQENLRMCLEISPEMLETQVSNFSVATVYRAAARAAARLKMWDLARDYLSKALPIQDRLVKRTPFFRMRLDHADLLREIATVEAGAGNRTLAEKKYREALHELEDLADHSREIFWVWKMTETLEGWGEVKRTEDRAAACALYNRSLEAWSRWESEGGPASVFLRTHRARAAARAATCN